VVVERKLTEEKRVLFSQQVMDKINQVVVKVNNPKVIKVLLHQNRRVQMMVADVKNRVE
jgi:hypothetical protein